MNKMEKYEKDTKSRPHVVILGAGASMAALPHRDKNRKPITCMDNFFENLGMKDLIANLPLKTQSKNLEDIYSEVEERSKSESLFLKAKEEIENCVFDYFNFFTIPDEPTIYDFLLLSLREKDLIASFNWDPILIQAGNRLIEKGLILNNRLPKTVFLHGNVGVIYDPNKKAVSMHSRYDSNLGEKCSLLFPVAQKDYTNNVVIKDSWAMVKEYLRRAYILTIFGYSAPKTDIEAVETLKEAWNFYGKKLIEEIEIIDKLDKKELKIKWHNFSEGTHLHCAENFFESMCGKYPRRTTEQLFDVTMLSILRTDNRGFKSGMSFDDIKQFIKPLLLDEILNPDNLANPYRANFNPD